VRSGANCHTFYKLCKNKPSLKQRFLDYTDSNDCLEKTRKNCLKGKNDLRKECVFCNKMVLHIEKTHLVSVHKNEAEIKHIMTLDDNKKTIELKRLGNKGDHLHNLKVSIFKF